VTKTPSLSGAVALVTGASRGVGKGIADVLALAGARVYVTGRSFAADAPRTDGRQPLRCDHTNDADTAAVFDHLFAHERRLDILVNSAWSGYERMVDDEGRFTWPLPFWQQPAWRWDAMFGGGVRAAFVCSQFAARWMYPQQHGLIVNISFWAAQKYLGNTIYGAAKCATDRLTQDIALELAPHNVTVVSLYPGLVRTEKVLESAAFMDFSNSESPQFCGRAVAHLYADPQRQRASGKVVVAAQLAAEFDFTDIDGRRPVPLTLADV
jgi:NAD(P)-dependent dehydrogenase (short-subunit alcohol dehydrogenase family)